MRTLKLLSLGVIFAVGTALQLNAQAQEPVTQEPVTQEPATQEPVTQEPATQEPGEKPQAPTENPQTPQDMPQAPVMPTQAPVTPSSNQQAQGSAGPRFFLNVNFAGQAREQTFTETATFTKYNEQGAVATTHVIGGGPIFDASVGMRVWRNFAIGIGYSSFNDDDDAGITARVPDPVVFGTPRTESVVASGLEHSENVVHLQFIWTIPYRDRFELAVMAGPSFFTVRQDLATVTASNIADPPPLIETITITNVKDSPVGFNVGADGSYHIRRMGPVSIGVGLFARFASASLDLPSAAGATIDGDVKAGGFQGGGGLRLGF